MTVTQLGSCLLALRHFIALVLVIACTGSSVATPRVTPTRAPAATPVVTPTASAVAATKTPATTPAPSAVATPITTPTDVRSTPPPTQSPDARCGQPAVDASAQLSMDSRVLDEADTTTSAVPFGGALFVAGWLEESPGGRAAIWRSDDGTSWERFEPEALGTAHVWDLLETETGLLAVGGNLGPSDLGDAAMWSSADGVTWRQVEAPAFDLGPQHGSAFRIAEGGPGYIVVGSQHTFSEVNVVVWLSSDGVTWETVPLVDAFESAFPTSLLVRDDGLIVLGISICDEGGCTNGAVLTSTDGREWERHRESEGPADSITPALHALVQAGPTEILGVGTSYEDVPLAEVDDIASGVWRSEDARSWELVAGSAMGRALTIADGRFFASGSWGAECQRQNPSVWVSTDRRDWQPVWVSADGGTIERMASWRGRLVMIGPVPDYAAQVFRSTVWIEAP